MRISVGILLAAIMLFIVFLLDSNLSGRGAFLVLCFMAVSLIIRAIENVEIAIRERN